MRTALLCLFLAGCATQAAATKVTPVDYRPIAAAVLIDDEPAPVVPAPAPVSGVCSNCNGKGKLGDGTVFVNCPVCGGDGKVDSELTTLRSELKMLKAACAQAIKERNELRAAYNERDAQAKEYQNDRDRLLLKQHPTAYVTAPRKAAPAACANGSCYAMPAQAPKQYQQRTYRSGPVRRLFGR